MRSISFTVPGVPYAQPRQRSRIATSKSGKQFINNYTPLAAPVNAFKASVAHAAMAVPEHAFGDAAVSIEMDFHFPRPASHYGSGRNSGKIKASAPKFKKGKPDLDNLEKAVQDALTGIVYGDDAQIVTKVTDKRWTQAEAMVLVTVTCLE